MEHFCTYFDRNFIYQGLALYFSLRQSGAEFRLHVLCLDDVTYRILERTGLPELRLTRLAEFEHSFPQLEQAKASRSRIEYYWTLTPFVLNHCLASGEAVRAAYLDADLCFFNHPSAVFNEWGDGSLYIIPHRFGGLTPHANEEAPPAGRFNVGLVGVRNDETGKACVERWAGQCLEWCYFRQEDGKLGDQKYLDEWPERYGGCVVSQHHGIGPGGWNILNYKVSVKGSTIFLDEYPLVFLHFNFVNLISSRYFGGYSSWKLWPIYRRYAQILSLAVSAVTQIDAQFSSSFAWMNPLKILGKAVRGGIIRIPNT